MYNTRPSPDSTSGVNTGARVRFAVAMAWALAVGRGTGAVAEDRVARST